MTNAKKPLKSHRVPDTRLSPAVRRFLAIVRKDLEPFGWSVHVQKSGKDMRLEFRNPLSPVASGIGFDPSQPVPAMMAELREQMEAEPEFARTRTARAPAKVRPLIGGLRWAATSYGWTDKLFGEVIDLLRHFRVLADDEWTWLNTIGPHVLTKDMERKWRKHVRLNERR
ncbi:MAG TPA: hypothetical protein VGV88_06995 [Candidatus Dormibacteraeota bacterium]|nr:hypothetical protein [Candidatus Dormibacteraeota bacterium]